MELDCAGKNNSTMPTVNESALSAVQVDLKHTETQSYERTHSCDKRVGKLIALNGIWGASAQKCESSNDEGEAL